jgi:hypothetical protein
MTVSDETFDNVASYEAGPTGYQIGLFEHPSLVCNLQSLLSLWVFAGLLRLCAKRQNSGAEFREDAIDR